MSQSNADSVSHKLNTRLMRALVSVVPFQLYMKIHNRGTKTETHHGDDVIPMPDISFAALFQANMSATGSIKQ